MEMEKVSWLTDTHGNQIERFEGVSSISGMFGVELRITIAKGSPLDRAAVEAWYWRCVGAPAVRRQGDACVTA